MQMCAGAARGAAMVAAWCGALAVAIVGADYGASGLVVAGSACARCGSAVLALFGG